MKWLSAGARAVQPFFAEVLLDSRIAVEAANPQPAALPAQASAISSQDILSIIAGASILSSVLQSSASNFM